MIESIVLLDVSETVAIGMQRHVEQKKKSARVSNQDALSNVLQRMREGSMFQRRDHVCSGRLETFLKEEVELRMSWKM